MQRATAHLISAHFVYMDFRHTQCGSIAPPEIKSCRKEVTVTKSKLATNSIIWMCVGNFSFFSLNQTLKLAPIMNTENKLICEAGLVKGKVQPKMRIQSSSSRLDADGNIHNIVLILHKSKALEAQNFLIDLWWCYEHPFISRILRCSC